MFLVLLLLPALVLPIQEVQYVADTNTWFNIWPFVKQVKTKFDKHVFLAGWVGELPYELKLLVYQLGQHRSNNQVMLHNRLILHGPPGNGKTTLARNLAQVNAYNFCEYKGSTLVNKYVGSGAQATEKIFTQAIEDALITNKPTLIFIDEIEQIAANNTTEFRSEHDAALRTLWLNLDQYKNDNRIFFICATNPWKKIEFIKNRIKAENLYRACLAEYPDYSDIYYSHILNIHLQLYDKIFDRFLHLDKF